MTNPLTMKSWSPCVAAIGVGVLSRFAFAVGDRKQQEGFGDFKP